MLPLVKAFPAASAAPALPIPTFRLFKANRAPSVYHGASFPQLPLVCAFQERLAKCRVGLWCT